VYSTGQQRIKYLLEFTTNNDVVKDMGEVTLFDKVITDDKEWSPDISMCFVFN